MRKPSSEGRGFSWLAGWQTSEGQSFAIITAGIYGGFTLLPDSHSLMVQWPWVAFWQMGVISSLLWLLCQAWSAKHGQGLGRFGNGLVSCLVLGLLLSTVTAIFPDQAGWYGLAALGLVAALLALRGWLTSYSRCDRLLMAQGLLSIAFIVESLGLWGWQTWWPELSRLRALQSQGLSLAYDFNVLELRNWAPIGHQNYGAGYLLLGLPLLVGLSWTQRGRWRFLWLLGIVLGLLDLYTTSSRGGWLGLGVACAIAVVSVIGRSRVSWRWLGAGSVGVVASLALFALANNRLRSLLAALLSGKGGGELAFRLINGAVGWQMGSDRPLTGIGLGGVPLLYQHYRPIWAGRESELVYQLHSTPLQLWAELGMWGIVVYGGAMVWLLWGFWQWLQQNRQPAVPTPVPATQLLDSQNCSLRLDLNNERQRTMIQGSLFGGLFAYAALSLTDYQLDNVAISGILVIDVAALIALSSPQPPRPSSVLRSRRWFKVLLLLGSSLIIASAVMVWPIHRAWQLSSEGFTALRNENLGDFTQRLEQAHQQAQWEPYYPYQLGMNLGYFSEQAQDPSQKQSLQQAAIDWLKIGIERSPYQEFGYHNLGWLLLKEEPTTALPWLTRAAQLVPAKRGAWFAIGWSLLAQDKTDLAIQAFTLEALRNPSLITNPLWRSPQRQVFGQRLLAQLEQAYQQLLQDPNRSPDLAVYLRRSLGSLYWWQGRISRAQEMFAQDPAPLSQGLLELAKTGTVTAEQLAQAPAASALVIQAWLQPDQRDRLLEQAWFKATQTPLPTPLKQPLQQSMDQAESFGQWLREQAPARTYRRERSGFNVLSRHIDGPIPTDFYPIVENIAVSRWFSSLFTTPAYFPELDATLQSYREELLLKLFNEVEISGLGDQQMNQ